MTPLRKILRELNLKKLEKLKTNIAPNIVTYDNKNDIERRLKKSIDRNENLDVGDVVSEIVNIVREGKSRITSRIREAIQEIEISKKANHGKVKQKEFFVSSEFFQALRYKIKIKDKYRVYQERKVGKGRVDLMVEQEDGSRKYPIELKMIDSHSDIDEIYGQLGKYLDSTTRVSKMFLVLVIEDESKMPRNDKYVKEEISKIEEVRGYDVKVIPKGPIDLRYK